MQVFQTPYTKVRRWINSDLARILEIYGDQETIQWVGDGTPITLAQAQNWLEVTKSNYEKRGYGMFTILDISSGDIIGFGGLVHPDNGELPEVKYAFSKNNWGRGLASDFVFHLVKYAKEELNLKTIIATTYPENAASKRVLTKCGFIQAEDIAEDDGTFTSLFRLNL